MPLLAIATFLLAATSAAAPTPILWTAQQLDKNTPYDIVTKIMATCGYAGYTNIKFAVTKRGEEG